MSVSTLIAFAAASALLIAIPGPNGIYIVTRSAELGRRAGLISAIGVETGTLVHILLAVFGVGALIAASPAAFAAVKYAGVAYLVYLGIRALRSSRPHAAQSVAAVPLRRVFRDGVVVNLLNPKVVLFFLAFLPQFVTDPGHARSEMLLLGMVFFILALTLDVVYALAGGLVSGALRGSSRALGRQHLVVGGIYLSLGAYTAFA